MQRSGTRLGKLGGAVAPPDLRMVFFRFGEGIVKAKNFHFSKLSTEEPQKFISAQRGARYWFSIEMQPKV